MSTPHVHTINVFDVDKIVAREHPDTGCLTIEFFGEEEWHMMTINVWRAALDAPPLYFSDAPLAMGGDHD
jgi:hypothetical protein